MGNVIDFPEKGLDVEINLEEAEKRFFQFEERIASLSEILDLNIQGMYHVMEVQPDEIMMSLLQLSAIWSVRADISPEDYMGIVKSTHLEVFEDGEE